MIRYLSIAALIAIGATAAYAQSVSGTEAIKQRQDAMDAIGDASKVLTAMNKGEAPFDAAKASDSFKIMEQNFTKVKGLFPDDSKTGETDALPPVWEKKAEFLAKFDKAAADAKAAVGASKDDASFKASFKTVIANCGGCHKEYRKPQKK